MQLDSAAAMRSMIDEQRILAGKEEAKFESEEQESAQNIATEQKMLDQAEEKLKEELDVLEEQEKELDAKIGDATASLADERELTKRSLDAATGELEELLAQVKAKEEEIASIQQTLGEQDEAILAAAARFDRQKRAVEQSRADAEKDQEDLLAQKESLRQKQVDHDNMLQKHAERLATIARNQEACINEAEKLEKAVKSAQKAQEAAAALRVRRAPSMAHVS